MKLSITHKVIILSIAGIMLIALGMYLGKRQAEPGQLPPAAGTTYQVYILNSHTTLPPQKVESAQPRPPPHDGNTPRLNPGGQLGIRVGTDEEAALDPNIYSVDEAFNSPFMRKSGGM
jgi:hypothetical protein